MNKTFFSVATFLGLFFASCSSNPTLTIKPENDSTMNDSAKWASPNVSAVFYMVNAPSGWNKKDTVMNGVQFCFLTAPALDSNFNTNMSILSESMQNLGLDEYKKNTQAAMKSSIAGFSVIENGDIQAVDIKGSWFRYVMQQSGIKMDVINYTFPKNGIAYILTGSAKAGSMDKYRSTFDAVAKSFKLKN